MEIAPTAAPVSMVKTLQAATTQVRALRGPKRSANQPAGHLEEGVAQGEDPEDPAHHLVGEAQVADDRALGRRDRHPVHDGVDRVEEQQPDEDVTLAEPHEGSTSTRRNQGSTSRGASTSTTWGPVDHHAVLVLPATRREDDPSPQGVPVDDRGHEDVGTEQELVVDVDVALVRVLVLEGADDGLAGLRGLPGEGQDLLAHLGVQRRHPPADLQVLRAQHPPRGHRELHHGHEGVGLGGADDQLLVDLVEVPEGEVLPAADQVRAVEGVTHEPLVDDARDSFRRSSQVCSLSRRRWARGWPPIFQVARYSLSG